MGRFGSRCTAGRIWESLVFGDRENDRDRFGLGDDCQRSRAIGLHEIARVHEAQSDAAINGRSDITIGQIDIGIVQIALVKLDRAFVLVNGGELGVILLFGDGIAFEGFAVAVKVQLRVFKQSGIMSELTFGLKNSGFVRARVNLNE